MKKNLKIISIIFLILFVILVLAHSLLSTIFLELVMVSGSLYLLWKKDFKETVKRMGVGDFWNNTKYTIIGLLSIYFLSILIYLSLNSFGINDQNKIVETIDQLPLYVLLLAIILAPISEELLFRAYLSKRLIIKGLPYSGILFSSILFSIVHISYGSLYEFAGTFVIGIVLASIYYRSKSIVPCVMIHFIYNLISIYAVKTFVG
ncbi:MAG: CPBP family intramembrane glutamic endopeptidase [Candidatus Micrarchaeota archaeon]